MNREVRARCAVCGQWNHADVEVCPACGTRHPGREATREHTFQTFWPFMMGWSG
jgi:uncharacterized OB-fold protein